MKICGNSSRLFWQMIPERISMMSLKIQLVKVQVKKVLPLSLDTFWIAFREYFSLIATLTSAPDIFIPLLSLQPTTAMAA